MSSQKIFITGGRGYIGSALVKYLRGTHELTVLTRKTETTPAIPTTVIGSLETIAQWQEHLRGIDAIVHLAGTTHSKDSAGYMQSNVAGMRELIRAAEYMGVKRFIFVSTRAIGASCGTYGESKKQAEDLLRASSLDWEIARVGETYDDAWSSSEGINKLARTIMRYPMAPIITGHSVTLCPIHRDDVVASLGAMITTPHPKSTYILAGPESLTFLETAQRIAQYYKRKTILLPIPLALAHIVHKTITRIGIGYPDQWDRLVCHKDGLSENVERDLAIRPRAFLKN